MNQLALSAPVPAAPPARPERVRPAASARAVPWTALHAALVAMLLTYVWRVQDLYPVLGQVKVTILASLAALGLFLLSPAFARVGDRQRHPVARWMAAILVLCVLSVPGGVYPGHSARFIYQDHVKTVVFAVLLMCAVRCVRDVERFMAAHVAGATLYCVLVLTRFQVGADGRLGGLVYYDANDLALLVVCTFPLVVLMARPGKPWPARLFAAAALALFVVTIIKTGSRGGFLGLVAVFGVMQLGFRAVPRAQRVGALVVVGLLLAMVGGTVYWDKMRTLLNPTEDYNWQGNAESGRMEVWKRGMGYMLGNPVLGVGAQGFGAAEGMISEMAQAYETTGRGFKWSAAHNSFVQIGAELGIPGLLAFLALLYAAFATTLRLGRAAGAGPRAPPPAHAALAQALTAALVGYVVCGFFLSQAYSAYLYSILALVVALDQVSRDPSPVSAPAPALRRRPVGRGGLMVGAQG